MRLAPFAIALSLGLLAASGASAKAAQCKDAHGKFIKCPPAAAAAAAPGPAAKAAKAAPCKDAKGKFIKCGTAPAGASAAAVTTPAHPVKPASKPVATTTTHAAASTTTKAPTASAVGAPAGATAKCRDGTWSMSKTHSGSCSHHGGVASWLQ